LLLERDNVDQGSISATTNKHEIENNASELSLRYAQCAVMGTLKGWKLYAYALDYPIRSN